ncbi:MAG TPA: flagellar filament capping protein FliD [Thermodesulfobacteriota bacterium]|nr:flagellar filament capping protein FliD [Thermodesulfobacteriota bacterium]
MSVSSVNSATSATAGKVQYSGLASDTNWVDFVDELMEAERFHINELNDWRAEWNTKITALQGLDAKILILEQQAQDLSSETSFYSRASSSSSETVLTVTNTSAALPGAHTITVASAVQHTIASQGWADRNTTPIGDSGGDLVIQVGSHGAITIDAADISAATTLQELQDLINNDAENSGVNKVTAAILNDGSATNPYRLSITADNGGKDYALTVTRNPTRLNFCTNDISPADTSGLTAATTTTIASSGSFTAVKSVVGSDGYRTYTFTGPATQQTVGSGSWTIFWSGDHGGGSGTIELGGDYTPGESIEIEDGISVSFGEGIFEGGSATFTMKAYATDIDDIELGTWSGTATPTADGNYCGNTNKTFSFSIVGSGSKTVGTDSFDVAWFDTEGNTGTITVSASEYTGLEVAQGVTISFAAGTVTGGDSFSLDVFNTTVQDAVDQGLAQAEVETHSGFSDLNSTSVTVSAGHFSYTYAGITTSIAVPENTTLAELRDLINNDENNPGIIATIVNDGTGLNTAYHLQLAGTDSGAMNRIENITHSLDNFSKAGSSGYGFSETQKAQNAMLKVDGYPTDEAQYIQRSSNSVSDLLTGITVNLHSTGTATISTVNDIEAITAKIEEFVDAVNGVLDYIKAQTARITAGDESYTGPMIGNYAFQIVQQNINSILTSLVSGLVDGTDTYTHLSQIGIQTDDDTVKFTSGEQEYSVSARRWTIDSAALAIALNNDIEAVCSLFVNDTVRSTAGIAESLHQNMSDLSNPYTDANPGIVSVLIENYEGIIENIDSKIDREERRLDLVENRLNTRYSQLEAYLKELQGQTTLLTSMIEAMTRDND